VKGKQPAFWFAVAGVSLLAQVGFNIAADKLPFQSLKTLRAYATQKNG